MAAGILPVVDKQLLHIEGWLQRRLVELDAEPHGRIIRQYATWHLLPRLRARADSKPLTVHVRNFASIQVTTAGMFLAWLDRHERALADVTQADLDAWYVQARDYQRVALRDFLTWAAAGKHAPKLTLPKSRTRSAAPITQHRRLALLRRIVTDDRPRLCGHASPPACCCCLPSRSAGSSASPSMTSAPPTIWS